MEKNSYSLPKYLASASTNGIGYVVAQAINFITQLILLRLLGKSTFGPIGVAQTYILSVIFIGEIGFPSYFIRAASQRSDWHAEWRLASCYRLGISIIALVGLLVYWRYRYGVGGLGYGFLLCSSPGVLISAINPTPLLIGQKTFYKAAAALPLQWTIFSILGIGGTAYLHQWGADYLLGSALSIAIIVQVVFQIFHVKWPQRSQIQRGTHAQLVKRSLSIWLPSLLGTLNALALTFEVEHLRPGFLAWFVIANQVLTGLRGINFQAQRVLLPILSEANNHPDVRKLSLDINQLVALTAWATTGFLVSAAYLVGYLGHDADFLENLYPLHLMFCEWLISILGTVLVTRLLSVHKEHDVSKATTSTFLISILLQLVTLYVFRNLVLILFIRILCAISQIWLLSHFSRVKISLHFFLPLLALATLGSATLHGNSLLWSALSTFLLSNSLLLLAYRKYSQA